MLEVAGVAVETPALSKLLLTILSLVWLSPRCGQCTVHLELTLESR